MQNSTRADDSCLAYNNIGVILVMGVVSNLTAFMHALRDNQEQAKASAAQASAILSQHSEDCFINSSDVGSKIKNQF